MKKKLIKQTFFIAIFFIFVVSYYYLTLIVSENKTIAPESVESFLLIPNLLKDEAIMRIGTIKHYTYASMDGPKPLIITVKISTIKDKETIKNDLKEYFLRNGFKENEKKELTKNRKTIFIGFKKRADHSQLVYIDLWEY